jgi:hypothetical protein
MYKVLIKIVWLYMQMWDPVVGRMMWHREQSMSKKLRERRGHTVDTMI